MGERHLIVLDAAVPTLVGAVIVLGETLHGGASARPAPIVLGILSAGVLVGRRRWPGWTLATSGTVVAVLFHVDAAAAAGLGLAPAGGAASAGGPRRGRPQNAPPCL